MIYFIQTGEDGPIKIGKADDISQRLAQLQTASPYELRVLGRMDGAEAEERELHRLFGAYHIRGEWFSPVPALLEFIQNYTWMEPEERNPFPTFELGFNQDEGLFSASARIYLVNWTTQNEGDPPSLTPGCLTLGEINYEIDRLIWELEGLRGKARTRFAEHRANLDAKFGRVKGTEGEEGRG